MKNIFYLIYAILITSSSCGNDKVDIHTNALFANGKWEVNKLGNNVIHLSYYSEKMFNAKQRLQIIYVKSLKKLALSIGWSADSLRKTSSFAKSNQSNFAINGSFFHPKEGGPVCFLKIDGKIIQQTRSELSEDYFINGLDSGALVRTTAGMWQLAIKPNSGWQSLSWATTILSAGPILIHANKLLTHQNNSFNNSKFSRTAIGMTSSDEIILLVADGNSKTSAGLTIHELAQVMAALGCTAALNLDGGGSSTMYIKGKHANGIINQPTDYDHYNYKGERAVSNAIMGKFN